MIHLAGMAANDWGSSLSFALDGGLGVLDDRVLGWFDRLSDSPSHWPKLGRIQRNSLSADDRGVSHGDHHWCTPLNHLFNLPNLFRVLYLYIDFGDRVGYLQILVTATATLLAFYYYSLGLAAFALTISASSFLSGVHRLLLLVLIFLLTAGLYLLYDFYFLGLAYVIVYSGAIAIIFLFVL